MRSRARIVVGLVVIAFAAYLVMQPLAVGRALDRMPSTSSQTINLRASWGGTLLGLGAFVVWLRAWRPWYRVALGLLGCTMAGIAIARGIGFALDGDPDCRQYVWIIAELALVIASVVGLALTTRNRR